MTIQTRQTPKELVSFKMSQDQSILKENMLNLMISMVFADGLAPLDTKIFEAKLMIKFRCHFYG